MRAAHRADDETIATIDFRDDALPFSDRKIAPQPFGHAAEAHFLARAHMSNAATPRYNAIATKPESRSRHRALEQRCVGRVADGAIRERGGEFVERPAR